MKKIIFLLLIAITGCSRSHDVIRHDYIKNYTIGDIKTAYIGQPIVKARDFFQKIDSIDPKNNGKNLINYVVVTDDFTIKGNYIKKKFFNYDITIEVKKDKPYLVKGGDVIDGVAYKIVDVTDIKGETYGLLMDASGSIVSNKIYNDDHDHLMTSQDSVITPSQIAFSSSSKYPAVIDDDPQEEGDETHIPGNINYELLYGGKNNVTLTMTYREFTADDLARPSFYQNLVYETYVKQLRFKDTLIDVIEASNEKIVYKVIEDGLKASDNLADNKRKYEVYLDKFRSKKK